MRNHWTILLGWWVALLLFQAGCHPTNRSLLPAEPSESSWLQKGALLYQEGRFDDAIDTYRKILATHPRSAAAYYNLGIALLQKQDFPGATQALRHALRLNPTFSKAYNNLGIALSHQGNLGGAITAFRHAIRFQTTSFNPTFHFNLGVALWRRGDLTGARKQFQTILLHDPGDERAENALHELLQPSRPPISWMGGKSHQQPVFRAREAFVGGDEGVKGDFRIHTLRVLTAGVHSPRGRRPFPLLWNTCRCPAAIFWFSDLGFPKAPHPPP